MARPRLNIDDLIIAWGIMAEAHHKMEASSYYPKKRILKHLRDNNIHVTIEWWNAYRRADLITKEKQTYSIRFKNYEDYVRAAYKEYYGEESTSKAKSTITAKYKSLSDYSDDELIKEWQKRNPGKRILWDNEVGFACICPWEHTARFTHEIVIPMRKKPIK